MSIEIAEIIGPSYWASYLINGDASGIEAPEVAACDAWLKAQSPFYYVSTKDDEKPWFTNSYRRYGGTASGGDVLTYIFHRQRRNYTKRARWPKRIVRRAGLNAQAIDPI